MRNIAMKLNLRCGNYNHTIQLPHLKPSTIILGADVTHPGVGSLRGTPSIAAVVGSIDESFARFPGFMRLNPSRQESIDAMQDMVYDRLLHWFTNNGNKLPTNVLFYHDGVSDSQFAKVRHSEVTAIRAAWEKLRVQKYSSEHIRNVPSITAVVVTKRHNTRLFPCLGVEGVDAKQSSTGNCLPGTVVDSGITSPYYFDFFLQSHHANQGTGKPAHYSVLENDMNFGAEELQDLTFQLCHTYGKAASAVSYAPPAYYADRLCERGRMYLQPFFANAKEHKEKNLSEDEVMKEAEQVFYRHNTFRRDPWHPNHVGKMFWM